MAGKKYTAEEIRERLKDLFAGPVQSFWAEVKSVNEAERTCSVNPINGSPALEDVMLKGDLDGNDSGITEFPAVGSQVVVSILNNDEDTAYLSKLTVVDKVVINGKLIGKVNLEIEGNLDLQGKVTFNKGANLGVPLTPALVTVLNTIVADINALKALLAVLAQIGTNAPSAPVLGALVAPFNAYAAVPLIPVEPTTISNPNVLQ